MEHQIKAAKPRKHARLIRGMYEMADDLDSLAGIARFKPANRAADAGLADARPQSASMFRALAEVFTRCFLDGEGR